MKLHLFFLMLLCCTSQTVHASANLGACLSLVGSQEIRQYRAAGQNPHALNEAIQGLTPKERADKKAILAVALIPASLVLLFAGLFIPFYSLVYAWLLIGIGVLLIFTAFFLAIRVLKKSPNAKSRRLARFVKRFGLILFFGAILALLLGLIVSAIFIFGL